MSSLFATGHAVDIVLAVMLVEMIILIKRRGHAATIILAFLPGALILLAVRAALTGAGWQWVALALAASFPAHLADLRRRGL
ncbi:hypothetical protein [Polymorphobacter sp. PAMC 29334]|uniref:hypothetical protein n=1 Tax=Polymorphobacter sp. PAMC 29334 TaxID=2862331 RepID=UPI001D015D77|nr:hypothetical protein [Polymorphobacter sp. PAMC 29334]